MKRLIALMLCLLMVIPVLPSNALENVNPFKDVDEAQWYYDAVIYAITEKPVSNDVIVEMAMKYYNIVVTDGEITSKNIEDIGKAVSSYNEALRRVLYIKGVDKDIILTRSYFHHKNILRYTFPHSSTAYPNKFPN